MRNYAILLLFSLLACHKDPVVPPPVPPIATSKLDIVWQVPILPDTSENSTVALAILDGDPVYCLNFYLPSAFLQLRDGASGALKWKYDQWLRSFDGLSPNEAATINNKLIVNAWHRTYCINAQGTLDWAVDVTQQGKGGDPFIIINGGYIYKEIHIGTHPKITNSTLVRTHYVAGKWDTLVTIQARDSFVLSINPPIVWVNPQGDTVLIIRDNGERNTLYGPYKGSMSWSNLYAYNLRTKQYDWQLVEFQNKSIMANPPLIYEDRYYIASLQKIHCLDLITGQEIWSIALPNGVIAAGFVQHKNWLIAQGGDRGMWAVDMNDGHVVWYNPQPLGSIDKLFYYDGVVYFTSFGDGRLYAINAETGATIWAERTPNWHNTKAPYATFGHSYVAIDPERKVLYVSDNYYAMCIKLPK